MYFLLLIGVLITVHEFGHFLLARLVGVRVLKFSIGFGPKLVSFRRGYTEYKIALLPFGGYVKMEGDDPSAEIAPDLRGVSFLSAPLWKRWLIVLAGPGFNFLLPLFVLFPLFLGRGTVEPSVVGRVQPGGPAWEAGIRPGDRITRVADAPVSTWYELVEAVSQRPGKLTHVEIRRGGERRTLFVDVRAEQVPYIRGFYEGVEGRIDVTNVFSEPRVYVRAGSPAEQAGLRTGDLLRSVDGRRVRLWEDVRPGLVDGTRQHLRVQALRPAAALVQALPPGLQARGQGFLEDALAGWVGRLLTPSWAEVVSADVRRIDGADWGLASAEFALSNVEPGTPAARVGLQRGDLITALDGREPGMWMLLEHALVNGVGADHRLTFERNGETHEVTLRLEREVVKGEFNLEDERVVFGAEGRASYLASRPEPNQARVAYAVRRTLDETGRIFRITVFGIGGLLTGSVPLKEMGGPILIAQVASKTSEEGWVYFLNMLVWISINLGLINLLPIPILDGGHLLVFTVEFLRRKPLSLRARQVVAYVGLAMILLLTVLVFTNDILRNWDSIRGFFTS
jgi:regulator of sigma E protease